MKYAEQWLLQRQHINHGRARSMCQQRHKARSARRFWTLQPMGWQGEEVLQMLEHASSC